MTYKELAVAIFQKVTRDEELLDLMEVPYVMRGGKKRRSMEDIKKQFLEERHPGDLVDSDFIRLCVYELPTTKSRFSILEQSYIQCDIYVTKVNNIRDRRTIRIADRLKSLLHHAHLFDHELRYYNRNPDAEAENPEWSKYGITFCYDNITI